jgi:hypothetical protein
MADTRDLDRQQTLLTFSSRQSIAPMMWAFFGIAVIELIVVHALLANWYPRVAAVLFVATLATIIWLGVGIRSLRMQPSVIDGDDLVMRAGRFESIRVRLSDIASITGEPAAEAIKAEGVRNLALIAHPNVLVSLSQPLSRRMLGRERIVHAIAHRFDDAPAFIAVLSQAIGQKSLENMEFYAPTSL